MELAKIAEKMGFDVRGALDEKNSTPGMIYGMAMARDLGLLDGWTVTSSATSKSGVMAWAAPLSTIGKACAQTLLSSASQPI